MQRATIVTALALLVTAAPLAACAQAGGDRSWERLHTPPPGSVFVLRQPLEIPPREGQVFVQDGRIVSYGDVDPFRPHCAIELRGAPARRVTVPPGRHPVVRAVHDEDPNLTRAPGGARAGLVPVGLRVAGGPSQWLYATELYLGGTDGGPAALWRLRCGHWEDPSLEPRFLTLDEIRAALGPVADLETP